MPERDIQLRWHPVGHTSDLPEGRVKTVSVDRGDSVLQICLTHTEGTFSALDNACPHQGGPLGEGSIECDDEGRCYLRCPWHGWDFDPVTGRSPGAYDDGGLRTYPLEVRAGGEIWIGIEEEVPHRRTITDVMAESMVGWGLTHVFGMVGHSNLGLADAVRRRCEAGEMEFIGIRHEGAAAFAASAFGKLTGRPAACLTIAGPGATNLYTGCWDAKVDRAPLLALTGQVNQQVFGPGAFQELPLKDAFSSVAAFSHLCLPGSNHGELMGLAIKTALVERQVAHLIFPDDTQTQPAAEGAKVSTAAGRLGSVQIRPPREDLARAIETVRAARRPVIIVGHGARFEMEAVQALAEELRCPVLTTFKGKGILGDCPDPEMPQRPGHPLGCGVLGRSGTPIASWFMNESDVLLVFGASFSNHTGITPKKPIIQVDNDRAQLARFHPVDHPLWGEIGETAREMLDALSNHHNALDQRDEIARRWAIWRTEKQSRLQDRSDRGVSSIAVFDAMNRLVPADAIVAVDVGNNTYSFGRYFEASGRQAVLMSGYLGSIGFGYPAAMGAWAASRAHHFNDDPFWRQFADRPIVCVTGDGGFGQYPWEVNTAVRHGMNLTHILLNNNELGKISKEQKAGHWSVWQTGLTNPDIAGYVTSCGGLGIRVERPEELMAAIREALAYEGPATVEVMTDAELI
jgi:thiamine pyrophosphate-dependent acetolactate synthase large subunit-like protein/nitrite reductase/ring-hydroxylating ferredoxin subunit